MSFLSPASPVAAKHYSRSPSLRCASLWGRCGQRAKLPKLRVGVETVPSPEHQPHLRYPSSEAQVTKLRTEVDGDRE